MMPPTSVMCRKVSPDVVTGRSVHTVRIIFKVRDCKSLRVSTNPVLQFPSFQLQALSFHHFCNCFKAFCEAMNTCHNDHAFQS